MRLRDRIVVTDEDGALLLNPGELEVLRVPESVPWASTARLRERASETGELLLYPTAEVVGVIRASQGGFDAKQCRIDCMVQWGGEDQGPPDNSFPWGLTPARTIGLYPIALGSIVDEYHRFKARVPKSPRLIVRATCPGWAPTWKVVEFDDAPPSPLDSRFVELEFKRGVTVRGVVRDKRGRPVARAEVSLYVTIDGSLGLGMSGMGVFDGGVAHAIGANTAQTEVRRSVTTDKRGHFAVESPITGDGLIVVFAKARPLTRLALGKLEGEQEELALVVDEPVQSSIRLTYDGVGMADARCSMIDVTDYTEEKPLPQVSVSMRLDPQGRAGASWLIHGRKYALVFMKPPAGVGFLPRRTFVYRGQAELEWTDLGDEFK